MDRASPATRREAVDPVAPVAVLLAVALSAEAVGVVERHELSAPQPQAIGFFDRVAVVAPAHCGAMVDFPTRMERLQLTGDRVRLTSVVALLPTWIGSQVWCPRDQLHLDRARRSIRGRRACLLAAPEDEEAERCVHVGPPHSVTSRGRTRPSERKQHRCPTSGAGIARDTGSWVTPSVTPVVEGVTSSALPSRVARSPRRLGPCTRTRR